MVRIRCRHIQRDNNDVEIIYGRYPWFIGMYNREKNKIYINEIVKKYSLVHENTIKHEKSHYKNNFHKYKLIIVFWDLFVDWKDLILIILTPISNPKLYKERADCEKEFSNLSFTEEEKKFYEEELIPDFSSSYWFYQKIYDEFKPGITTPYIIIFGILCLMKLLTFKKYIMNFVIVRVIWSLIKRYYKIR